MRAVLVTFMIVAITACHSRARPDDFVPFVDASAAADAACTSDDIFEPIAATGLTPAGPLDVYHYTHTYYGCTRYIVELSPTMVDRGCSTDRALVLSFEFPQQTTQPGTGSFPATAYESPESMTDASFEAINVDPPTAGSPQIIGRFVTNAPGWSIDLSIDVHSQELDLGGCTLRPARESSDASFSRGASRRPRSPAGGG
jgi:hypothetical protein